jgi:hypothetical protein
MIENGEVRKHSPIVVAENWLFTIVLLILLFFAIPLLRDVIYGELGIYGGIIIPTPPNALSLHILLGFILIIIGFIHIATHAGQKKKELIMKYPLKDFKEFLHSLFYLIGFAKREAQTGGERYNGRQRVVYLALLYTMGLSAISGVSMYIIQTEGFFLTMFKLTHILANALIILVFLFHLAINIRRHDSVALKCSYATGKLPLWYIRKNHKIWFLEIQKHEKRLSKQVKKPTIIFTKDPVAKAMIKMYSMDGINLSADVAEKLAEKFRKSNKPKDVARFIEISRMI